MFDNATLACVAAISGISGLMAVRGALGDPITEADWCEEARALNDAAKQARSEKCLASAADGSYMQGKQVPQMVLDSETAGSQRMYAIDATDPAGPFADGTYTGTGIGVGGALTVTVEVKDGKISVVDISPNNETKGIGGYEAIIDGTYKRAVEEAQGSGFDVVAGATRTTEAIVVDDRLARHIRARHPQMRLIASFNKPLCWLDPHAAPQEETAYYQRLLELYDEVVVRCEYALDNGRIGLLSPEDRERVEVVVNQICVPNCDRGLQHMRALQDWDGSGPCQGCLHLPRAHEAGRRLAGNVLVSNRRIDELAAMGVTKMKLGGRNAPVQWFLDCVGTYVFEPTGAYAAMKDVLGRDFATERERNPRFAQYDLPR